jgi:hypothetical protein
MLLDEADPIPLTGRQIEPGSNFHFQVLRCARAVEMRVPPLPFQRFGNSALRPSAIVVQNQMQVSPRRRASICELQKRVWMGRNKANCDSR